MNFWNIDPKGIIALGGVGQGKDKHSSLFSHHPQQWSTLDWSKVRTNALAY
jgi:hypothetical protein